MNEKMRGDKNMMLNLQTIDCLIHIFQQHLLEIRMGQTLLMILIKLS